MFGIHGAEHEITVPIVVKLAADRWEASAHFQVPYVKWGLKNPSALFLRVGDIVNIDFRGAGDCARVTGKPEVMPYGLIPINALMFIAKKHESSCGFFVCCLHSRRRMVPQFVTISHNAENEDKKRDAG
jgi:hypothetical protein